MIVLDTHIWVWWAHGDAQLPDSHRARIQQQEAAGLGVSAITLWEVAKLVEYQRLKLPVPIRDWLEQALVYPGVRLLELTPQIVAESTQLPGTFHRDPADQIIVATARIYECPLVTMDEKILAYPHVTTRP